jgi:hypothetical protein
MIEMIEDEICNEMIVFMVDDKIGVQDLLYDEIFMVGDKMNDQDDKINDQNLL